ncbi:ubiquinol-cytochrome c reductase iron-sulfur subunit [Plantactinospora sp. BB1]|uniref:cytochrome bc1 complex Rieske iron-sulfur subunit n=1 Tax=Plantactinospora sp. BB1 TaxID=2071627 RepID=UPI000D1607A0|nr:Rieske 2Fe-2S domain-containing protein [Plantactinospora sp. BB1]AVT39458.1 (2Fe-2S)-binding protein [Plantactinospora sp. BB1]
MSTANDVQPHGAGQQPIDLDDPTLSRFDIVREGARRDDIEIVHYEAQFPVPGTKAERRLTRTITLMFLLVGVLATAFLAIYIWWPWTFESQDGLGVLYTPLLGITLGLALLLIGFGLLAWGKKLLPKEVSIQGRHDEHVTDDERKLTGNTMLYLADEMGVRRRPLLGISLLAGLAPVGAVAAAPLIGGMIEQPHKNNQMFTTGWKPQDGRRIHLTHHDGTPIRPEDISPGGMLTVYPGIEGGATNKWADSPVLLFHLRERDAADAKAANVRDNKPNFMWGNYIAYSKICTHAGCPASLYEQQTNRLLCPCHQSQFLITDNARPVFGPANRRLPQLPLDVEGGFFVAKSDFTETVGPDFWERP